MTQLTAKPFTARPLAARPFTAYPFGESTSVSNPLVWLAAYPDSDGVMQAQVTGSGTPSFTVDDGLLLPDFENIYRTTAEDTPPWHGARKVTNLLPYSGDWTQIFGGASAGVTATETSVTFTSSTSYRYKRGSNGTAPSMPAGTILVCRLTLSSDDMTKIGIRWDTGGAGNSIIADLTSDPQVFSFVSDPTTSTVNYVSFGLDNRTGVVGAGVGQLGTITVHDCQIENVTGQANQNPSEYVPTDIAKAGAPELVTNGAGGFSGTTGWPAVVGSPTITETGGKLTLACPGSVNYEDTRHTITGLKVGQRYFVQFVWRNVSGTVSSFAVKNPTNVVTASTTSISDVTTTVFFTAAQSTADLTFYGSTAGNAVTTEISSITVKEATPGYEYYSYSNGNTVVDNVVVPAKGATLDPLPSLYGAPSYTNSLTYSNDLTNAVWTQTGTDLAALNAVGLTGAPNTATTLTDDNAAGYETVQHNATPIPNDSNVNTLRVFIKKDSNETRFPSIEHVYSGGTGQSLFLDINTKTGATAVRASTGTVAYEVNSVGDWWEVLLSVANNSTGNTSQVTRFYPAVGTVIGTASTAATGSIIVGNAELHLNKTIAAVRGSAAIQTTSASVTTTAISMSYDIANHSDTQGAYYCEWVPFASGSDVPNTDNPFLTLANTAYGPMNYRGNNTVGGHDSAYHKTEVSLAWVAETEHKRATVYDSSESKLVTNVDGTYDATEVTNYTGLFVGPYTGLKILYNQSTVSLIRNIRRYNLNYTAAKAKITELMS